MNLRKGKKTVEDICIAENEWWLKYTKEHYKKHVTVGEMFNKDLYGKYTVEEWLLFLLPSILNTETSLEGSSQLHRPHVFAIYRSPNSLFEFGDKTILDICEKYFNHRCLWKYLL